MQGRLIDSTHSRSIAARYHRAESALAKADRKSAPKRVFAFAQLNFKHLERLYMALPRHRKVA